MTTSTDLSVTPRRARVFNIEDQPAVSDILREKFQGNFIEFSRLGHQIENLDEVIAPAKMYPLSLFLIDINLKPGESRLRGITASGMTFIKEIKAKIESAYVVAYSTDDSYEEDCMKFGADDFLHQDMSDDAKWETSLARIKSTFLEKFNDASLEEIKGSWVNDDDQNPNVSERTNASKTQPSGGSVQRIPAWVRDVNEAEHRAEIECEIKGRMERRYVNSNLLANFKDIYSGKPITIVISNDNGKVLIEFENREAPDEMEKNPFADPTLQNSPIFKMPDKR